MREKMKLLYTLSGRGKELLSLMPDENVLYCVPVDLTYEPKENADLKKEAAGTVKKEFEEQAYLVVTGKKTAVVLLEGKDIAGRILFEKELKVDPLEIAVDGSFLYCYCYNSQNLSERTLIRFDKNKLDEEGTTLQSISSAIPGVGTFGCSQFMYF